MLLCDGDTILVEHLPQDVLQTHERRASESDDSDDILPLQVIEERYLRRVLARCSDDRAVIARRLGISERTLYRKTKILGIR